jgi:glucose-specific phosphotransferase system IIA component
MGFFDFLKKSAAPAAPAEPTFPMMLAADAKGAFVPMENIPDEVFAQGILGTCCGIDPSEGKVFAPAGGEITQAPDSGHALGIMTTAGVEVLIHVGVDTVEMKGDGFSPKVKVGDKVKKGDLLLEMDLGKIAAAGHPAVVITVVTNTDDFKTVEVVASGDVEPGADLIKVSK